MHWQLKTPKHICYIHTMHCQLKIMNRNLVDEGRCRLNISFVTDIMRSLFVIRNE